VPPQMNSRSLTMRRRKLN